MKFRCAALLSAFVLLLPVMQIPAQTPETSRSPADYQISSANVPYVEEFLERLRNDRAYRDVRAYFPRDLQLEQNCRYFSLLSELTTNLDLIYTDYKSDFFRIAEILRDGNQGDWARFDWFVNPVLQMIEKDDFASFYQLVNIDATYLDQCGSNTSWPGGMPLWWAVRKDRLEWAKILVAAGANVSLSFRPDAESEPYSEKNLLTYSRSPSMDEFLVRSGVATNAVCDIEAHCIEENMRISDVPDANGKVLLVIKRGTALRVLSYTYKEFDYPGRPERSNRWLKVQVGNLSGWIWGGFVDVGLRQWERN